MVERLQVVVRHLEQLASIVQEAIDLLQEERVETDALDCLMQRREEVFHQLQHSWVSVSDEELGAETKKELGERAARVKALDAQAMELARQHGTDALEHWRESQLQRSARELYGGGPSQERGLFVDRRDA